MVLGAQCLCLAAQGAVLWKKARAFSPKSGGKFPYKYRIPHSLFLV